MSYDQMDKPRGEERRKLEFEKPTRDHTRPFDTLELEKLPQPRDDDPPYRPWWVVER